MTILGIYGVSGRMGNAICSLLDDNIEDFSDILGYSRSVSDIDLKEFISRSDVIMDFSSKEGSEILINEAKNFVGKKYIIGTTGHNNNFLSLVEILAKNNAIMIAPNTSLSINYLSKIASDFSGFFNNQFKIIIEESHHIHKKDKPSGTAIMIKENIEKNIGKDYEIEIISKREGEVIGEHKIIFISENEKITISHEAFSRKLFANGAIKSAIWIKNKAKGLFFIRDMF